MNKKEIMDLMLSKVEADKKEAFIQEFRAAKTKEERMAVARKYDATLTKEEAEKVKGQMGNGGCSCMCKCYCQCSCM